MQQTEPDNDTQQDDYQLPSLIDLLRVIIKRWKIITGITIGTTLASIMYSFSMPNIYTAKAKFLPPQQQSGLLSSVMMQGALAAIGSGDILGESRASKLYVEMLKIESLRDPIIDKFKLQEVYKRKFREDVYKKMDKNITVISGKEGIITVSVDDQDPKRAADMANECVSELKKLTTRMSMTGAANSKSFLEERINKAREELTFAENNLKDFQTKYKTFDANQQVSFSASTTAQLTVQLTSLEVQLSIMRRTYAESSQQIKSVQQSIAVLKEKIARLHSNEGSTSLPGFEQIPERGQEYLHLMRKFKTAESVYEMLIKQYEVAKLNAANDVSSIQVIQKALIPERKSKPKRSIMVLTALFTSFLCSILFAFALDIIANLSEEQKSHWKSLVKNS
jgi:uncharacterized protein involved in exopolysaccharide biosynthesis